MIYSETLSLFLSNPSVSQHADCKSNSVRYELIQSSWRNYNFSTKTQLVYIERRKTT